MKQEIFDKKYRTTTTAQRKNTVRYRKERKLCIPLEQKGKTKKKTKKKKERKWKRPASDVTIVKNKAAMCVACHERQVQRIKLNKKEKKRTAKNQGSTARK
jgi:cytochrome c553